MYSVRKLRLSASKELENLCLASGELYNKVLVYFWRIVRKKGIWLSVSSLMKLFPKDPRGQLHSQSVQAVIQTFYSALKSWQKRRKTDQRARPPTKRHKYFIVTYKEGAIRVKNGRLILSNGNYNQPLIIESWFWNKPKQVQIGWNGQEYELRAIYFVEGKAYEPKGNDVVGIDLGEVHLACVCTSKHSYIFNGRELRAKRRYQNKLKAKLQSMLSRKKKGSKRWRRLQQSKLKQLVKLKNQIRDILHKMTTKLVSTLYHEGVQTVVIGDVRNIRSNKNRRRIFNQKIHQAPFGIVRRYVTYKAERLGMKVVLQDERYTTQTCPICDSKNKLIGRNYKCDRCGFTGHRDIIGACNIRQKYLEVTPVVGGMASPTGIRYKPNMLCSSP